MDASANPNMISKVEGFFIVVLLLWTLERSLACAVFSVNGLKIRNSDVYTRTPTCQSAVDWG